MQLLLWGSLEVDFLVKVGEVEVIFLLIEVQIAFFEQGRVLLFIRLLFVILGMGIVVLIVMAVYLMSQLIVVILSDQSIQESRGNEYH